MITKINDNETKLIQNTKECAFEAEAKAAKQRELIPYETRIKQFCEMLAEKQVKLIIYILHVIIFLFSYRLVHLQHGNKN